MNLLWCCCPAAEPEWATDCSALGTMSGSEWTFELPEFCISGTMWGDGFNYSHRDMRGICGGEASDCDPRYFRWNFVRWQNDSSDPADCDENFCSDLTDEEQVDTCGDCFLTVDDDGNTVDMGLSSAVTDIRMRACTTRKTNDPYGCSGTPSGDEWIVTEIDVDFRWVNPITVNFRTGTNCATVIDRSDEAENLWYATYIRRLKVGEPIATGTYTLSRLVYAYSSTQCVAVQSDGSACAGAAELEKCIDTLGDTLDLSFCETMWKPPSTITVYKSA